MIKLTPREYQKKIFETAKEKNTLVVLPTGLGKTAIALLLAVERQKKFPGSKALILAPTKPLVEQHLETFKKNLPELFATLEIFTGSINSEKRRKLFQRADIIFSTPQCISNDVRKGLYSLEEVSLIVIDEAHRCLKNYAYTQVVNRYKSQALNPRILGLTASPGHEMSKIKEICKHLDSEEIEIRSRDSEDVKDYLQELEFEKVEVDFPKEFIEIRVLLKSQYDNLVQQLRNRKLLFAPANKVTLLQLQNRLAPKITQRDFNAIAGISICAQAIKLSHAMELLETQTLSGLEDYMKNMIEQAKQKKSKAVQNLTKAPQFNAAMISLQQLIAKKIEHPKIEKLKEIIEEQFKNNPKSKTIIFSQFRETSLKISQTLRGIKGINSEMFVGQAKKSNLKGITSGLNQKQQKEIIDQFREGKINVLCATSIGEEGLDIPEVSSVIFYEPIPSAVRKIQRSGRTARLAPGRLIILITKKTRDEIYHYASTAREKKMHKTLTTLKEELKKKPKTLNDF